jgi:DNA-binding NarL/FixJ family response regulator
MKGKSKPPNGRKRARIFIVEDHPITRHGLTQLLNHEPDLVVCGEADNAQAALAGIKSARPDLLLADVTMAGKSGLELLKDVRVLHPEVPVLVLSMHDENVFAERIMRAGGRGYLMKSAGGAELLVAIRRVLGGEVYLSRNMSAQMLNLLSGPRPPGKHQKLGRLTDREFEVFQLMGQGLTSREIGERLHISSKTVDTHRLHIKDKLEFRSLPELVKHAVRWAATQEMI